MEAIETQQRSLMVRVRTEYYGRNIEVAEYGVYQVLGGMSSKNMPDKLVTHKFAFCRAKRSLETNTVRTPAHDASPVSRTALVLRLQVNILR